MLVAARDAVDAGLVSASVAALTEGVLRTMLITKLKTLALIVLAAGAIACGVGAYAYQGREPGETPGSPAPSPGKVEQAPSPAGQRDDAIQQLIAVDMEEFAAKVQRLVRHARQALAEGDMKGAVRDLKEIESDAGIRQDALRARRESAKDGLPTLPTHSPGSLTQPGADQAVPRLGPASSPPPGSAERRLDELERTVDRLVRAREKNGGEGTIVPQPAPTRAQGVVQKIDDRTKRVEINIGSDDGLTRGHVLEVYRRDRTLQSRREVYFLGRIQILGTNPDQAVAKVIELLKGKQIKEGDIVSPRTPTIEGDGVPSGAGQKK
jgi:hypothetical protein